VKLALLILAGSSLATALSLITNFASIIFAIFNYELCTLEFEITNFVFTNFVITDLVITNLGSTNLLRINFEITNFVITNFEITNFEIAKSKKVDIIDQFIVGVIDTSHKSILESLTLVVNLSLVSTTPSIINGILFAIYYRCCRHQR